MYCISYTTKLNTPSHLTAVDPANRSGIVGFEALHRRRSPEMHHAHFPINTPMKENPSSLLTPTHTPNHSLPLDQFIQIRVYIFFFWYFQRSQEQITGMELECCEKLHCLTQF